MGLREHFKTVFARVNFDDHSYVDQTIHVGTSPEVKDGVLLDNKNHAVYMGKIPKPNPVWQQIAHVLGWEIKRGAYSVEAIDGALNFAFYHLKNGEKVKFVVGYRMAEFCNGKDSVDGSLTLNDEMTLIQNRAKNQGREDDLELVDVQDEHPELFAALNSAADKNTGQIDVDKVFDGVPPITSLTDNEVPNALQIAHCLYAIQKRAANVRNSFKNCVPLDLRSRRQAGDDKLDPIDSYALFEVAIRLTDLVRGRVYQCGVDRQKPYDQIIIDLLSMPHDVNRSPDARALMKIIKNRGFRALHVKKYDNPYVRRVDRRVARMRTGIVGVLAGILGSIAQDCTKDWMEDVEKNRKEEISAKVAQHFDEELGNTSCRQSDNFDIKPYNEVVADLMPLIRQELENRYNLDRETSFQLTLQIIDALIETENVESICDSRKDKSVLTQFIDNYIKNHNLPAALADNEIGRPYEHFGHANIDLIVSTAANTSCEKEEDFEVHQLPFVGYWNANLIGTYTDSREYKTEITSRDLYVYAGNNGDVLMATMPIYEFVEVESNVEEGFYFETAIVVGHYLSANLACEVAQHFVADIQMYDENLSSNPD